VPRGRKTDRKSLLLAAFVCYSVCVCCFLFSLRLCVCVCVWCALAFSMCLCEPPSLSAVKLNLFILPTARRSNRFHFHSRPGNHCVMLIFCILTPLRRPLTATPPCRSVLARLIVRRLARHPLPRFRQRELRVYVGKVWNNAKLCLILLARTFGGNFEKLAAKKQQQQMRSESN